MESMKNLNKQLRMHCIDYSDKLGWQNKLLKISSFKTLFVILLGAKCYRLLFKPNLSEISVCEGVGGEGGLLLSLASFPLR